MKSMVDQAVTAAFAGVEMAEHKLQAFQYATQNLRRDQSGKIDALEGAIRIVYGAICDELNEAYRKVFMWNTLVPDKMRAKAKKLALDRFLTESHAIMQYLYPEGVHPSMWASKDSERFRKEIARFRGKKP